MIINRQTYSLLEWLGDVGGLFDALHIIGSLIIGPLSSYALDSALLAGLFRSRKSQPAPPVNRSDFLVSEPEQ